MASNWRSGISFGSMTQNPLPRVRLAFELARRGYRRYAAYPGAMYAGPLHERLLRLPDRVHPARGLRRDGPIGGYDVEDAIAYVWLSQGLLSVVGIFGPSWFELARRVQTGDVATDLQRPVDVQRAGLRRRTSAAPPTSCSGARCRSSCSARSSSRSPSPTTPCAWLAFAAQRRACRRRQLRDPLPRQPLARSGCSTTAARCC